SRRRIVERSPDTAADRTSQETSSISGGLITSLNLIHRAAWENWLRIPQQENNNMRRFMRLVSLVLSVYEFVGIAQAHHSQAGIFDANKTIEITGLIKSVSWRNPHGQILLTVKDPKGIETVWDAETASISILRNRGVDGKSIRVGDRVTIAG